VKIQPLPGGATWPIPALGVVILVLVLVCLIVLGNRHGLAPATAAIATATAIAADAARRLLRPSPGDCQPPDTSP
jgi:hypothetical protein